MAKLHDPYFFPNGGSSSCNDNVVDVHTRLFLDVFLVFVNLILIQKAKNKKKPGSRVALCSMCDCALTRNSARHTGQLRPNWSDWKNPHTFIGGDKQTVCTMAHRKSKQKKNYVFIEVWLMKCTTGKSGMKRLFFFLSKALGDCQQPPFKRQQL